MGRHISQETSLSDRGPSSVCLGKLSFPLCTDGDGHFDKMRLSAISLPDQALLLLLMRLSLQGLAGWQAADAVMRICGQFTADDVLPIISAALDRFVCWNNRELSSDYPFLYVNAHPVRIFGTNEASLLTVLSAVGVSGISGHRECLGFLLCDGLPDSWTRFLTSLRDRGLTDPDLIVSPFLPNMPTAAKEVFPTVHLQRCMEDLSSTIVRRAPSEYRREMRSRLRTLFSLSTLEAAKTEVISFSKNFADTAPDSVSALQNGFPGASTVFLYPRGFRPRLGAYISCFRKLTETICKREKILTVYPDREAVCLLIASAYYSFSQLWFSSPHPFISMPVYRKWKESGKDVSGGVFRRKTPLYY